MGARVCGAWPVVAVDVVPAKLELARSLGVTHAVDARTEDPVEVIRDVTRGGADYAFESVGRPRILAQAYEATRRGGTTVSIGLPPPDEHVAIPGAGLVSDERTLRGSYMGSAVPRRDIPRFMGLHRAGLLPVDVLISRVIALEDLNDALDALARGEVVRQVVRFS
jgi:Zn-dependent alcohol dehydrogenase